MKSEKKVFRGLEVPARRSTEEAWSLMRQRLEKYSGATVRPLQPRKSNAWKWAVAASVAVLMVLVAWLILGRNPLVKATAPVGEIASVTLPDGSECRLAGGSEINFSEDQWSHARKVKLQGRAFFDVKKGSSFTVRVDDSRKVEVLGTQFTMAARNGFHVSCARGKVRVTSGKKRATIERGEAVEEKAGELLREPAKDRDNPDWASGKFTFEETPLKKVCQQLESAYGIRIEVEQQAETTLFSGKFRAASASEAVDIVCQVLRLNYKHTKGHYKLIPGKS